MLQNVALRAQLVSGQLPGNQADVKELRKCLLRKDDASGEEERDSLAEVCLNRTIDQRVYIGLVCVIKL